METSDAFVFFCFFAFTEKNISLFSGKLLLRKLSIQSINEYLENRDQNSLDARTFSACNISLSI